MRLCNVLYFFTSRSKRAPPPAIVLHGQLEVGQGDGDASSHNDQNDEHQAQDAIQSVGIVAPHTRVDVIQLNVNRTISECVTPTKRDRKEREGGRE